jgi:hypothetical protein
VAPPYHPTPPAQPRAVSAPTNGILGEDRLEHFPGRMVETFPPADGRPSQASKVTPLIGTWLYTVPNRVNSKNGNAALLRGVEVSDADFR